MIPWALELKSKVLTLSYLFPWPQSQNQQYSHGSLLWLLRWSETRVPHQYARGEDSIIWVCPQNSLYQQIVASPLPGVFMIGRARCPAPELGRVESYQEGTLIFVRKQWSIPYFELLIFGNRWGIPLIEMNSVPFWRMAIPQPLFWLFEGEAQPEYWRGRDSALISGAYVLSDPSLHYFMNMAGHVIIFLASEPNALQEERDP